MAVESGILSVNVCPACGGSGWEFVEGAGVRRCQCKKIGRGDLLLKKSRIPQRFQHCSFDNLELYCNSLQRAVFNSKRFVEEYPLVDVGLLLMGSCGAGKTHLAVAILKGLLEKGIAGLFYDFRDLLKEIQDSYNSTTQTSELKVLAPVFDAEVLVLDELGASKPTEWVQETMTHIISKRYNDQKITIFTSNYQDITVDSAHDDTLTDRVGIRLRSRLHEMCRLILIETEGRDYRQHIKDRRKSIMRMP